MAHTSFWSEKLYFYTRSDVDMLARTIKICEKL